jgi:hypothetical protein
MRLPKSLVAMESQSDCYNNRLRDNSSNGTAAATLLRDRTHEERDRARQHAARNRACAMIRTLIWGAAVLLSSLVWRLFRSAGNGCRPLDAPPGADWVQTQERFVDPFSGETLDVWLHPQSGERVYVRARRGTDRNTD